MGGQIDKKCVKLKLKNNFFLLIGGKVIQKTENQICSVLTLRYNLVSFLPIIYSLDRISIDADANPGSVSGFQRMWIHTTVFYADQPVLQIRTTFDRIRIRLKGPDP